ncbi:MAG: hypothetical protein JWN32_603, partial [Solirubrobacterales bacterium]|nr:hypothetical protein [Solirubrobacterales bacterium]
EPRRPREHISRLRRGAVEEPLSIR